MDENGEVISKRFLRFVKKESLPQEIELIVVDETSMVSDEILRDLLSFGIKCLFCGDPAQLPPVYGTTPCFPCPASPSRRSCGRRRAIPSCGLRSARGRESLSDTAITARGGSVIPRRSLDAERRKALFLEADQIIVGTNRTRSCLNREIRSCLGIPPEAVLPCDGEKIVCTLNDWSKPLDESGNFHLVNGIVGQCYNVREGEDGLALLDFKPDFLENAVYDLPFDTGIFTEGRYFHGYGNKECLLQNGALVHESNTEALKRFKVRREDTVCRFEFAYALTCHKAQGSEYDFVIVLDESNLFENGKEWLYTAITRAKKRLLIIR